jgi:hypothetical protein
MKKKFTLIFSLLLLLVSCTLIDPSKIAPGYIEAAKTIKGVIVGYENDSITPELVKAIPYASSILKIGKGAPGLIILESLSEDQETWVSSDGIYLVFKEGRIIKTRGFFNNLVGFNSLEIDLKRLIDSKKTESFIYYYSYDDPKLINMKVSGERKFIKNEEIKLFGRMQKLYLIEESFENSYIGWKVTNKFWVDDEMFVWKSNQSISPKLPEFYVEVTKKPAN